MLLRRETAPADDKGAQMRKEWMAELKRLQARLEQNERYFNMICDFDMTEANIHERNALQMRYRYYLNKIREYDRAHRPPERESTALMMVP